MVIFPVASSNTTAWSVLKWCIKHDSWKKLSQKCNVSTEPEKGAEQRQQFIPSAPFSSLWITQHIPAISPTSSLLCCILLYLFSSEHSFDFDVKISEDVLHSSEVWSNCTRIYYISFWLLHTRFDYVPWRWQWISRHLVAGQKLNLGLLRCSTIFSWKYVTNQREVFSSHGGNSAYFSAWIPASKFCEIFSLSRLSTAFCLMYSLTFRDRWDYFYHL